MLSNEIPFRRVLALDTATRQQSLALLDGHAVLESLHRRVHFNHGSNLLQNIEGVLAAHQITLSELDLVAIGLGPGSFTGLRVGLALAKSICRAHDLPIVGVSSLAALAYPFARASLDCTLCPMWDARRGEVYAGLYSATQSGLRAELDDATWTPANIADRLRRLANQGHRIVVVGDAPRKYPLLRALDDADQISVVGSWADGPSPIGCAMLGRHRAQQGHLGDVASLEPNYIRPTDAELNFAKKSG